MAEGVKAYYSVLQFVPDLDRFEGANIGLVLFIPDHSEPFKFKVDTRQLWVKRFFRGSSASYDPEVFSAMRDAFEERLQIESERIKTLIDLRSFVETRGNNFLLRPPLPITVYDEQIDFEKLYRRLVGLPDVGLMIPEGRLLQSAPLIIDNKGIRRSFWRLVRQRKIEKKVKDKIKVKPQSSTHSLTFPYGFRNGQLNVIETATFTGRADTEFKKAFALACEGNEIIAGPDRAKLNVIASFHGIERADVAEFDRLFTKYQTKMWMFNNMNKLVEEIEATAKEEFEW